MTVPQSRFRAALLDPSAAVPDGLTDGAGAPAGRRFDVYRNNVVASLAEGLATGFPAIAAALGPDRFRALAIAHARAHPPRSPLMMHLGVDLPAFLEAVPPLARHGWLPDLARLELAIRASYHAADSDPVPAEALGAVVPERLAGTRLRLAPALRLVVSRWPVVGLRHAALAGAPLPVTDADAMPEAALVTRPGYDPVVAALDPASGAFLADLADGTPLGPAAERAATLHPDFDPGPAIAALLAGGAVIALQEDNRP